MLHLYEFKLEEESFVRQYNNFDYFLANPDYEGVYETHIPLHFRFMTNIGCICKFIKKRHTINTSTSPN